MQKQYERPHRGKYSRLEFEMHQMTRSRQQNNSDDETSGDILDKYLSELWPNIDEDFNGIDNFESRVFKTARSVISRYEIVAKTENLKLPVSADDRESVALFGILNSLVFMQRFQSNHTTDQQRKQMWSRGFFALQKLATRNSGSNSGGFYRSLKCFADKLIFEHYKNLTSPDFDFIPTEHDDVLANLQIVSENAPEMISDPARDKLISRVSYVPSTEVKSALENKK